MGKLYNLPSDMRHERKVHRNVIMIYKVIKSPHKKSNAQFKKLDKPKKSSIQK